MQCYFYKLYTRYKLELMLSFEFLGTLYYAKKGSRNRVLAIAVIVGRGSSTSEAIKPFYTLASLILGVVL